MSVHTILLAEDVFGWDGEDTWRAIPPYVLEGVEVFYHLSDLEPYERDMLSCVADSPLFEIWYWAGDTLAHGEGEDVL
jgi:hypothetical protein